jgi:3-phytase
MPAGNVQLSATYKVDPSIPPPPPSPSSTPAEVMAAMETAGASDPDDMWLWRHPTTPGDSLVIAADKGSSHIRWYDLTGKELGRLSVARPNNVDGRGDIFACSLRNSDSIGFYRVVAATRAVEHLGSFGLSYEPYGLCLYKSALTGKLYVFASRSGSDINQYEVNTSTWAGTFVRNIDTRLVEGIAAHDASGRLFYSEESRDFCVIDAEPNTSATRTVISSVGEDGLASDLEGVALVTDLYAIVSVQGRSRFAVFEMQPPNYHYRGSFQVRQLTGTIDSVSSTDGIDWHAGDFGGSFRAGIFLCHDDSNSGGRNQKAVPWERIAQALGLQTP